MSEKATEVKREAHQHLVLAEEVARVLVEDHAANGLQRKEVLWPDLGDIQGIKVVLVLVGRVNGLDGQRPFRVLAGVNMIVEILGGVTVIAAAHLNGFIIKEISLTYSGYRPGQHAAVQA